MIHRLFTGKPFILLLPFLIMQILAVCLINISDYLAAAKSEEVSHALRLRVLKAIFHEGPDHAPFKHHSQGKLISLLSRDIESLWDLFGFSLTEIISSVIFIITFGIIVLSMNPLIGSILILLTFVYAVLFYINGKKSAFFLRQSDPHI